MGFNPLEKRPYKFKNPVLDFYCPLCRSKRSLVYGSKLMKKHYVQIGITSLLIMLLTYRMMDARIFLWPLIVWGMFESYHKFMFRKEVPCPYCGFDATWYKRDVKVARRVVQEFWENKKSLKDRPEVNLEEMRPLQDEELARQTL